MILWEGKTFPKPGPLGSFLLSDCPWHSRRAPMPHTHISCASAGRAPTSLSCPGGSRSDLCSLPLPLCPARLQCRGKCSVAHKNWFSERWGITSAITQQMEDLGFRSVFVQFHVSAFYIQFHRAELIQGHSRKHRGKDYETSNLDPGPRQPRQPPGPRRDAGGKCSYFTGTCCVPSMGHVSRWAAQHSLAPLGLDRRTENGLSQAAQGVSACATPGI